MDILLAEIVRDYRGKERMLKVLLEPSNRIFMRSFSIRIISPLSAKLSTFVIRSSMSVLSNTSRSSRKSREGGK